MTTTAQPRPTPAAPGPQASLIECEGLVRIFRTADVEVQALQGLDLHLAAGDLVAVVGASGSGKSTLLNILSGLDAPSAGRVEVAGHDLVAMRRRERVAYQRHVVGFVWQQTARNLLPYLTSAENVTLPLAVAGQPRPVRRERVDGLLDLLGVAHCRDRRPGEMSGGEQQRVALAVALANEPRCCWRTSRPASSTSRRPPRSSRTSGARTPSSASPCSS